MRGLMFRKRLYLRKIGKERKKMDDFGCDMEYIDDTGNDVADTPVLDEMLDITDVDYDNIDYDEVAEYYDNEVDISEEYDEVEDMESDVVEYYDNEEISDELSRMLDEWEETGEDEEPKVYEYVKKR